MTVYPLFSPQSLIAEGSANYGIDVAFLAMSVSHSSATSCSRPPASMEQAADYHEIRRLSIDCRAKRGRRRYLNGRFERQLQSG
jgi:hypothetical protein